MEKSRIEILGEWDKGKMKFLILPPYSFSPNILFRFK